MPQESSITPDEAIEEISEEIQSLRELKALTFHQDYVYRHVIHPALLKLQKQGDKEAVDAFSHYYKTNRNIIAYLWKELQIAKNPDLKEELSHEEY
jgi:hypothetical protein